MPYYFYLPVVTHLTVDQQRAVDIPESLALSGGPGTGKSVVCLWRHIRNYALGSKQRSRRKYQPCKLVAYT